MFGVQSSPLVIKAEQVPQGGDSDTPTGRVRNTGRGWLDQILLSQPSSQALQVLDVIKEGSKICEVFSGNAKEPAEVTGVRC